MISIAVKYAYNKNGQVVKVTRPDGLVTNYDYDALGRVSKVSMPTDTVNYVYDANSNNLTAVGNKGSVISYSYDGGVLTKASWSGAVTGSVGVSFNSKMQVDTQAVNDGNKIGFQYDVDGLLTKAGDLAIKRDVTNGRLTGTTLGNVSDTLIYTSRGELASYQAKFNGSDIFKTEITETDNLGRIVEKRETVAGVMNTYRYGYDKVGQLVEVRKNGAVTESYAYDANGNRLGSTVDGQDRLISSNGTTYTYSANGELASATTGSATTTYQYDVQGNLKKVVLPNATTIEYTVDANNHIISKRLNGTVAESFLWEGNLRPVAMLDGTGTITARFIYAGRVNVPEYMVKDGVQYRLVTDYLGSVRSVVNSSTGEVVQKIDYDAFGKVVADSRPGFQPFGFAGGLYESKTGLVRFGKRDYNTNSGRWTDKEPLGFNAECNFYRYCGNDPVNNVDMNGLFYFAKRPLGEGTADWIPGLSDGPLTDWTNLQFSHEHGFFEDDKGGNIGFGPSGRFSETDKQVANRNYHCEGKHYDDAIMREALNSPEVKKRENMGYDLVTNNCQDWATALRRAYNRIERERGK